MSNFTTNGANGLPLYEGPSTQQLANIPSQLTALPQWVLFRLEDKVDTTTGEVKLNKIPVDAQTRRNASSTNAQTWSTFEQCVQALPDALATWRQDPETYRGGGLGFVFTSESGVVGIDLDKAMTRVDGKLQFKPWASEIVAKLQSYTEVSPSGTGLHLLAYGQAPLTLHKRPYHDGIFEAYDHSRYFTVTGEHLPGTPLTLEQRQDALSAVYALVEQANIKAEAPRRTAPSTSSGPLSDTEILDKARQAKNGGKFTRLFDGNTADHGGDDSAADMALCCELAFWTQDPGQIDRLFRQSGLMRPKWDTRRGKETYGQITIGKALTMQSDRYSGKRQTEQQAKPAPANDATETPQPPQGADFLPWLLQQSDLACWTSDEALTALAAIYHNKKAWLQVAAACMRLGLRASLYTIEQAVKQHLTEQEAETVVQTAGTSRKAPGGAREIAPPLPRKAQLAPVHGTDAAPWLESYISHSVTWSPRGAHGYHAATGLWALSTIAARRNVVYVGKPIYPSLFIAMVSDSTLFAKTTTAMLGLDALEQAGCQALIAPDISTPQAMIRSMSGVVPSLYANATEEKRVAIAQKIAFAAQRGWYHEEWGRMLAQMTRSDSPMSDFHGMLRWMDDGKATFESGTVSRDIEELNKPYLALLASATPHDLARFMAPGNAFWHDGFWPRFALVTPMTDEIPSRRRAPMGRASLPASLARELNRWHHALGIPHARIEEKFQGEKPTGEYHAYVEPLPCQELTVRKDVEDAFFTYNDALLEMVIDQVINPDLASCYGRFHMKALRIAMLLASIQGSRTIELKHWTYAQGIAEEWRLMLHTLVEKAQDATPRTRGEILDEKILSTLRRHGASTARDLSRNIRGYDRRELDVALQTLTKIGDINARTAGKSTVYALYKEDSVPQEETYSCDDTEIPF